MSKKVYYVVWGNTDLNEGRGEEFPKHICEIWTTAERLAKGGYVQGSDNPISEYHPLFDNGATYISTRYIPIMKPTATDVAEEKRVNSLQAVSDKAKRLGLSEEEIKILRNVNGLL